MSDKPTPMIGYRQELTENGRIGLWVMFGAPVASGIVVGLILSTRSPSIGGAVAAMVIGSIVALVGAMMVFLGRRYMPFDANPKNERDLWWDQNRTLASPTTVAETYRGHDITQGRTGFRVGEEHFLTVAEAKTFIDKRFYGAS